MKQIAIFASGSGSNAQVLMEHFAHNTKARVALVLSNNKEAYVLQRAEKFGVPAHIFSAKNFREDPYEIIDLLRKHKIDVIVLAGYMFLIPKALVDAWPSRILNIHPALLPKFGGKGMYGHHVHEAVIAQKEKKSGITIHRVNEFYDDGDILFQASVDVMPDDTPETLAHKIHHLEHQYYKEVVEKLCDE